MIGSYIYLAAGLIDQLITPHNKHFDSLLIRGLLHPWGFPQLRKAEQYSRNSSQGVKLHPYNFCRARFTSPGLYQRAKLYVDVGVLRRSAKERSSQCLRRIEYLFVAAIVNL